MRQGVKKLLAGLAIVTAMLLLGFSHDAAIACHPSAQSAHQAEKQPDAAASKAVSAETVAARDAHPVLHSSRPDHSAMPGMSGGHREIVNGKTLDRMAQHGQSRQHLCPIGKDVCCVNCPKGLGFSALPVRPRDAVTATVNWPSAIVSFAQSLAALTQANDVSPPENWPPNLAGRADWRSVLLMGSARLRI